MYHAERDIGIHGTPPAAYVIGSCGRTAVLLPCSSRRLHNVHTALRCSIGNLERLARIIDAGFLNDQSHKQSTQNMQWATRSWDGGAGDDLSLDDSSSDGNGELNHRR